MDKIKTFTNKKFIIVVATFCCFLWGSAYPAVKNGYLLFNIATEDIPSKLVFAGYRFTLAGIIVLIIAKLCGNNIFTLSRKNISNLFLLGLTQTALQYIFFYIGLAHTTGVNGAILNSTGAFFSVILAHFIYTDDKLNAKKITGCILGFAGVMLVNFNAALFNFSFNIMGDGFIVIAAFVFAAGAIYGKKLTKNLEVMVLTGYNLFLGGIALILLGFLTGGRVHNFTLISSSLLIYMALLSSAAFTLWALLLKYNKVGSITIFNFLIPVFGALLSSIFLGESIFELKNLAALLLVCLGIWMVNSISKK